MAQITVTEDSDASGNTLPQQSQHLLILNGFRSTGGGIGLRQCLPSLLGIGGHDRHLLEWIDQVDRSHQLHTVLDGHARI